MKKYILLFRGINVGGKNILPMKSLAQMLESMGYAGVKTYIQSGNVVLRGKTRPGKGIGLEIESKFGFRPEVMVLECGEFELAVKSNPFSSEEGKSVHLFFCEKSPNPATDKLNSLASGNEAYDMSGKVFYLSAPNGIGKSKLVAGLEKCLGVSATGRNLNTVNKILELSKNA